MSEYRQDYQALVESANIPLTEKEYRELWDSINEEQGGQLSNNSDWSPFWLLVSSIVTKPAVLLSQFLIRQLIPNIFLKTSSGAYLDIFAWGRDVEREQASHAEGFITFEREATGAALIIPAGTLIQSPEINGNIYQVATKTAGIFGADETVLDIDVIAVVAGASSNLAPGYYSTLVEPINTVTSVVNPDNWLTLPGIDMETDESLRQRCRNKFTAVGRFHHDSAYRTIISEFASISVDYIHFEHGAPRGPGSANAYIMINSGIPTQTFINSINTHINDSGEHGHGDDMLCFPMPALNISLMATIYLSAGIDSEQRQVLLNDIEDMIRCAFRENSDYNDNVTRTFPFSRFSFSRLDEELHTRFLQLESIEFNQGDIVATLELPVLASLIVDEGVESISRRQRA